MSARNTLNLAIRGAKWVTIGMMSQKIYQVVVIIVLARLLTPEDFGLVAVAMLFLNSVGRIKQLGMHSALIQRKDSVQEAANVFFFTNILLSLVVYAAIFACSDYIAGFFSNMRAALVLKVMALILFTEAASAVQRTLTVKQMQFRKQMMITLCESVANGGVALILAFSGYGVWALVFGSLAGTLVAAVLWWVFCPWRPTLSVDGKVAREVLSVGVQLTTASTLSSAMDALCRMFVGRSLGLVSLGFYDFANRIINLPLRNMIAVGQQVALPAFCRAQEDYSQIRRWFLKMTGYSCLLMSPIAVCFLLLPDHFVPIIYGDQWLPVIPLIRILALLAFLMPLSYSWPVYVSTGNAALLSKLILVRFVVTVPMLFFAARISLSAVCLAELLSISIFTPINLHLVGKLINVTWKEMLGCIKLPMWGTVCFTLSVLILQQISSYLFSGQSLVSLAFIVIPAVGAYLLTIRIVQPDTLAEMKHLLISSFAHQGGARLEKHESPAP